MVTRTHLNFELYVHCLSVIPICSKFILPSPRPADPMLTRPASYLLDIVGYFSVGKTDPVGK